MLITLTVTCVVASALLSLVYQGTKTRIAEQEKEARLRAIREVLPEFDNDPVKDFKTLETGNEQQVYYIGKARGKVIGIAFLGATMGYGGMIDVMVGVQPDGDVTGIEIVKYQETPGLGTKASKPAFRDQFSGKDLKQLNLKRDGGEIQAITGATITSRAVTKAVRESVDRFLQNKKKIV